MMLTVVQMMGEQLGYNKVGCSHGRGRVVKIQLYLTVVKTVEEN